jgi:putative transposase
MVERMQGMSALEKRVAKTSLGPGDVERAAIREMVKSAKDRGLALTGPDGLLKILTKTVLETALDEEMNDHLGYAKHASEGRNGENSRNGLRAKTVITDTVGPVEIAVPRDRDASFDPQIVKKRQRRLGDVDTIVLSLYARGLTTGEISAHFAEIYGASEVISARDHLVFDVGKDERRFRDVADLVRAGGDVFEGFPAGLEQGEAAFTLGA